MRKITKMFFALALVICGAMSANAANKVVLQYDFDGESPAGPAWGSGYEIVDGVLVLTNETAGTQHSVQANFSASEAFELGGSYTLTFKIKGDSEGSVHALLQYNDGSTYPHIEFPLINFTTEYQTVKVKVMNTVENAKDFLLQWGDFVGTIYVDDIKLTVYTEKEEVYDGNDPALRWTNVITNSDMEGEELISFVKTENDSTVADSLQMVVPAVITDGIGNLVDGVASRGIKVSSFAGASTNWDAQFFIAVPNQLSQGTSYKVTFDYRSSIAVSGVETQAHKNPGNYNHYSMLGNVNFTEDWQSFSKQGKLDASQANGYFQSVAFNLAINKDENVDFYFDNVYFYVQDNGMLPQYGEGVILLHMARPTNISQLVAATGKSRLVYPEGTVTMTKNGNEMEIISVEAYDDGRLYAFVDDVLRKDDQITLVFNNPEDPAYQIQYTDDNTAVPAYDSVAYYNANVAVADAIDWEYAAPKVMSITPAEGSFNLPADLTTFTVKFDIPACTKTIEAMFGSEKLTVTADADYAEEITFTRPSNTALTQGDYELNIYNIRSETGDDDAFWGDVTYAMTVGLNEEGQELMTDLANALATAQAAQLAAVAEIYSGAAYNELTQIIESYDEEYKLFTSPAECRSVAKILTNAGIAMDNHRKLVDNYYATVNGGINARDTYSESKFAQMTEFVTFKEDLAKYLDELGEPIKLYDADALNEAVNSLSPIVNNAAKLFTTGPSKYGTTGIAALVERIRLGAEALKALGVSEEDELIKAANAALTDDDNLAEQLKERLTTEVYKALSEGKDLFAPVLDETTEEMVTSTVDLTVFFKNPNIYISDTQVGGGMGEGNYNAEYMPGWTVPEGAGTPKYAVGTYNVAAPHTIVDGTFLQWQASFQIEQTVNDLPAGIYTIRSSFSERTGSDMNSVFYVKTSATEEGAFEAVDSVENKGHSPTNDLYLSVNNILVVDGQLTVGALSGAASCCHFNAISVELAGTIEGFDYKQAYDEWVAGIEGTIATPDLLGVELYDLNGRRINKAQQGVILVKKYMSDGTIVVEKVIKK